MNTPNSKTSRLLASPDWRCMRSTANPLKHILRWMLRWPMLTAIMLIHAGFGHRREHRDLGITEVNASPATYFTFREEGQVFEDIGIGQGGSESVTAIAETEQIKLATPWIPFARC